jgi:hypothetical protein
MTLTAKRVIQSAAINSMNAKSYLFPLLETHQNASVIIKKQYYSVPCAEGVGE